MISAVWANDGGDKVTRDELRVSGPAPRNVLNSIWDGSQVNLFGAKNEVVAFNLVLEAANGNTSGVTVSLNQLSGPGGFTISSATTSGNGVFNYVGRNIELFFVRYLQIKGLSKLFYEHYDERHIPKRFQRPYTGAGYGTGTWQDRPDHDKFYPDIAVPLELEGQFSIASGSNQSIWTDIYIPKNAPAGFYNGTINITEGGALTRQVPVSLEVRNFSLPDTPSSQTMLYLGYTDVNRRYLGVDYPSGAAATTSTQIRDRHFQMAHRHKIQVIDNDNGSSAWGLDQPRPEWLPRLNGSLFSSAKGYDGPGVNTGNGVYSIGTYSTWNWKNEGETGMRTHSNNWVNWFDSNSPATEYFLYLIDESSNYAQTNTWAQWINNNPGTGNRLMSFATASIPHAVSQMPQLDIAAGWMASGITSEWENAVNQLSANPDKRAYMYNGKRPASGSFAIEDDGVALRELPWGQYKKKIDRWFFWESTYYNNYQGGQGQTNVFQKAATFGGYSGFNSSIGETGWNYSNGDGLLFYPGTDVIFPNESYGVLGPIASLRLKYWRRGIQDIDYVKMAAQINPTATQNIVQQMVPSVMWEPGISDPNDPTWVRTDISWSIDPDDWEIAREQLADIIEGS